MVILAETTLLSWPEAVVLVSLFFSAAIVIWAICKYRS